MKRLPIDVVHHICNAGMPVHEGWGRIAMVDWSSPGVTCPVYGEGSVVELRIHGVGGEPPSVMTRGPDPLLVAGEATIGVYRAHDPVVEELGGGDKGDPPLACA